MSPRERSWLHYTIIWCVYCLTLLWLFTHWPIWGIVFALLSFAMALGFAFGRRLLLPLVLATAIAAAPARAWVPMAAASKKPKPDVTVIELACGVVVIVIGTVVIWKLWHFCDKHFPPPPPPPPPPPTNPPPPWQTNLPPTNYANTPGFDLNWHGQDISGFTNQPAFNGYALLFCCQIQSSTNLVDWIDECSITQWWGSAQSLVIVYTNGVPALSSYSTSSPPTNYINIPSAPAPAKFFRSL